MSFHIVEQATPRLQRSELAVSGNQTHLFEKAAASRADVVFLDLEDSVAPQDKPQALSEVVAALNHIDWSGKTVTVRINGLDIPRSSSTTLTSWKPRSLAWFSRSC